MVSGGGNSYVVPYRYPLGASDMPTFQIPYGKTHLPVVLPDDRSVVLIAPNDIPRVRDPWASVKRALDEPVGGVGLDYVAEARSAAIAIADKTRPLPADALRPLLARLEHMGIAPDAITLLIATGTHAPMQPDEFEDVLPADLIARYCVASHDCDDDANLVNLGSTERGTPVLVNRRFHDADLRIVVGNLEPHQFMGYSGGVKSAAIGLAGRATITTNHKFMLEPAACLGRYEGNPVRADVEDIGRLMDVHVAVNLILTRDKHIARVIAGDPVAVMHVGIPLVRELVQVPVPARLDLVLASPGGHPKDICLYKAQKALAHAALITRDGGTVIVAAACPEGTGSAAYDRFMEGMSSHEAVLRRFEHEPFQLGPHKAFQIARDATRVNTVLVSDMDAEHVRRLLLTPAHDLAETVRAALDRLPPDARIGIMPVANATIPVLT
jgi:nickel-dependent lactate racemase